MKSFRISFNDDYSILRTPEYYFYFGYEETEWEPAEDDWEDDGGNWCFVVRRPNPDQEWGYLNEEPLMKIPQRELEKAVHGHPQEVAEFLLVGIGLWMAQQERSDD